jgi:hypothetical protein
LGRSASTPSCSRSCDAATATPAAKHQLFKRDTTLRWCAASNPNIRYHLGMDSTILAAIIAAAATVGTTLLAHYLARKKVAGHGGKQAAGKRVYLPPLTIEEAQKRIAKRASQLHLTDLAVPREVERSPFGTLGFRVDREDGKGALYCHASGDHRGEVYYVRKGIGWYYNHELQGPASFLGLPLSDEDELSPGVRRNLFEGGNIVWKSSDDSLSVYDSRAAGDAKLISRYHF